MPLCSKCQQSEATVHFTTKMNGVEKKEHFCKNCAPTTGYEGLSLDEIMAFSIIGKKCEFCGQDAFSGVGSPRSTVTYWCRDCGMERSRISAGLLASEHPDLIQQIAEGHALLSKSMDPDLIAKLEAASQKATRLLKDRRRQDGRDRSV